MAAAATALRSNVACNNPYEMPGMAGHLIGFEVIDAGSLKNARYLEPLAGLNIYLGYGAGLGTSIAPAWLRRA